MKPFILGTENSKYVESAENNHKRKGTLEVSMLKNPFRMKCPQIQ